MLKQIALSVALLMGVCAFAQAPEAPAATESADKFSGIQSTVQLVKEMVLPPRVTVTE